MADCCPKCSGLLVRADFVDSRVSGGTVEGWRCVNCGRNGDQAGPWGVIRGDETMDCHGPFLRGAPSYKRHYGSSKVAREEGI